MFEVINPSVTVTGRPISQWIGDVTRQNVIELAERGAGGGYVWSVPQVNANGTADQSPLSTHPDYWYSIPFIMNGTAYQTTLTVEFSCEVNNGTVDVALWCEGRASAVTSNITTGTHTLSLTLPPRLPSNDMRCALLVKSNVGALVDSGDIIFATEREIRIFTSQAPAVQSATHLLLEITGTTDPVRGWEGQRRYHAMRGSRRPGSIEPDLFEVWPNPDQALDTVVNYTLAGDLYALGTISLYSMQARFETAQVSGLPYAQESYAGQPVRAAWLQRISRFLRDVYLSAPQYAWIGGANGIYRSTYVSGQLPGNTVVPARYWGSWTPGVLIGAGTLAQTAIRARTGVDGVVISILYSSAAPVRLLIQFNGVLLTQITLPAAPAAAQSRNFFTQPGTISWRHGPLSRDQCGSQDIGLHGTELEGFDCDTARFSLVTIQQEWDVITPTVGDLVTVDVFAGSNEQAYFACASVRELQNARVLPNMNNPAIAPLQPIETVSWDNLVQRMDYLYESRLRCVYSEANNTPSQYLIRVDEGQTSTLAAIAYTTSPDMPFGAGILRFTVDAECIGAGTLTVSFTDTVTTVSLVFTARATLSGDLAVTSNTSYTLAIGGASSALTADGRIYLMRIEEIYP
jgi:hypothetical protein